MKEPATHAAALRGIVLPSRPRHRAGVHPEGLRAVMPRRGLAIRPNSLC